jgi:hypothetical protein
MATGLCKSNSSQYRRHARFASGPILASTLHDTTACVEVGFTIGCFVQHLCLSRSHSLALLIGYLSRNLSFTSLMYDSRLVGLSGLGTSSPLKIRYVHTDK